MKFAITINGEERSFDHPMTVDELLALLQISPGPIAVAINNSVIAGSTFKETLIHSGDRIEIVRPLGGG